MSETEQQPQPKLVARYTWPESSIVSQMEVMALGRGRLRCQLTPNAAAKAGQFAEFPAKLYQKGFKHCYPDVVDGQNVLMVDQVKDLDSLLVAMRQLDMVNSAGTNEKLAPLPNEAMGLLQRAKNSVQGDTLKWSGRIGLIGHAAILGTGLIRKDANMAWGAAGALNPILLAVYGNGKADIDFNEMMHKMCSYFRAEGVELPLDAHLDNNGTLLKGLNRFLATYPVQIGHSLGCIGSYNLMKAGWSEVKAGNIKSLGLVGTGATSLVGNSAVVLVPEKKKNPDEEETTTLDQLKYGATHIGDGVKFAVTKPHKVPAQLWDFVRDSPLRFNGLLNLGDNVFMFIHAKGQMEHFAKYGSPFSGQRGKLDRMTPYFSLVTALSFSIATGLSMISSKNRDASQLQDEMYEPIYAAAAKFLAQMPPEDRSDTLTRMAVFLSEQEEVKDGKVTAEQIVREVGARIEPMQCSPWISKIEYCRQSNKAPQAAIA